MTTPPHIEAIARAILKMDGSRSDREVDLMRDNGSFVYKYTVEEATLVWNLARKATLEEAAKWVDQRRDNYIEEHGSYDPETDAIEFPGNGNEYVGELEEIAEEIRALITKEE